MKYQNDLKDLIGAQGDDPSGYRIVLHQKEKRSNVSLCKKFVALQAKLQNSIKFFQTEYYKKMSQKLLKVSITPKCYWNILKILLNVK